MTTKTTIEKIVLAQIEKHKTYPKDSIGDSIRIQLEKWYCSDEHMREVLIASWICQLEIAQQCYKITSGKI
jgi:hypothetical protein